MSDFNWTCPHCERDVTISVGRFSVSYHTLEYRNSVGRCTLQSSFIVCPNNECRKYSCSVILYKSNVSGRPGSKEEEFGEIIKEWSLIPPSAAKHFPDYIPLAIREDYEEACLIRALSPKASATLSRRCLQGILRDFWGVKPGRLVDEIAQIKERIDVITWDAIEAVRKLGNIGAHMEKDINLIVDVDPQEANLLIGLVETLLREWYIAREERKSRFTALISAAKSK